MRRIWIGVCLVTCALAQPVGAQQQQERTVTGTVKDVGSGQPVANATVTLVPSGASATTAADGTFSVTATGPVTLRVSAKNYDSNEVVVDASATTADVALTHTVAKMRVVTGLVEAKGTGEPIPGATILVVGSAVAVTAEADGSFSIPNLPLEAVRLKVSAIGYESGSTLVLAATAAVTVALEVETMESILVTGRAPAIVKTNLAGGASVVQGSDLTSVSADNIESALQGKITGANIQQNSGAPGGGIQVSMRGVSTINGRNTPLYVIDGVIVQNIAIANGLNAITASAGGSNSSNQDNPVNRIADLNPNDIANIEVLKGASAAALYGSKASNGVVIITTKRGRAGEPTASVTQRLGFRQASNRYGFREFGSIEEAQDTFGSAVTPGNFSATPFDHEAEVFGERDLASETVASLSGGDGDRSYQASLLVRDTPGLMKNTGYQKQSGRVAIEQGFGDKLTLGLSANLIHSNTQRGVSNNDNLFISPYMAFARTPTFYDIRPDADGNFTMPNPFIPAGTNPLQTTELMVADLNDEEVYRALGALNARLQLHSDATHRLALSGVFGLDFFNYASTLFVPPEAFFEGADGLLGTSVDTDSESEAYNVGANLHWGFTPSGGAIKSATTLGFTFENRQLDTLLILSQNQNAGQFNVDQGSQTSVNQTRTLVRDIGFYLQEELQLFDDSLSVIGAALIESSSNNGDGEALFLYPKVGLVYSVPYLPDMLPDVFNQVRARVAYGEAGNQPNFASRFTALTASNNVEGAPALTQGLQVGDPDIEPERQREFEFGVDVIGFDSRLVVELSGYYKVISNMLLNRSLGGSAGFNTQQFNGGKLRNIGAEASLQVEPVKTTAWSWLSRTLFTINRSKILDLPVPAFNTGGFGTGLGAFRIEEGQSATQIVGDVPDGMGGTALIKIGDAEPTFRMTFVNNVSFKTRGAGTFGVASLFDWQQGSDIINLSQLIVDSFRNGDDFRDDIIGDGLPCSLSLANGDSLADIKNACGEGERRLQNGSGGPGGDTREYVQDASFFRIREVKLFWTLPESFVEHLGPAKSLQLSVSARNLHTFTKYQGLDPEVSNFGNQAIARNIDVAPYAPSRVFWFSAKADF